jgi:hypothetical protein
MRIIAYLALSAISCLISIGRVVSVAVDIVYEMPRSVAGVVIDIFMSPFRMDWGAARHLVDRYVLAAFRVIGLLKPEYDESLETAGQSLRLHHPHFDPLC